MKRKIALLVVSITLISFSHSFGQFFNAGFSAGATFGNQKGITPDSSAWMGTKRLFTPELGPHFEIGITDEVFINTGFSFRFKGFRYESVRWVGSDQDGDWEDSEETLISIEMHFPVELGYKHDLGDVKVFGMLGPYLDYSAYVTNLYKVEGEDYDNDPMSVGNTIDDDYKPLEIGLGADAGIQFNRFQFSLFLTRA